MVAAANPRKQLAALELSQLRDLQADRLDRLVVTPVIKPDLAYSTPAASTANGEHPHNAERSILGSLVHPQRLAVAGRPCQRQEVSLDPRAARRLRTGSCGKCGPRLIRVHHERYALSLVTERFALIIGEVPPAAVFALILVGGHGCRKRP